MEIEQALYARLIADTTLKALIGDRLYPDELPQGCALPAVYYIDVSDVKRHILTGQIKQERPTKQFTIQALRKSQTKEVAAAIKACLCDYHGTLSGLEVQHIMLNFETGSQQTSADGTIRVFVHDLEFEITYVHE